MSRYALDDESIRKLAKVVKAFESSEPMGQEPNRPRVTGSYNHVVKVIATGTPYATGIRLTFDSDEVTTANQESIKIKEVDGKTLKVGSNYVGWFVGYHLGIPVYLVSAGGGGGGVQNVQCVGNVLRVTYSAI